MSVNIKAIQDAALAAEQEMAAAVTAIQTETANIATLTQKVADLQAQVAAGESISDADLQAVVDGLTASTANLTAAIPAS